MRTAKPLLLITTPLGVIGAVYEAFRQTGGLGFLMLMLMLFVSTALGSVMSASAPSLVMATKALTNSSGWHACKGWSWTPNMRAAASVSGNVIETACMGSHRRTAMRETVGKASLSSPSRLPLSSGLLTLNPVAFLPGCARLATSP